MLLYFNNTDPASFWEGVAENRSLLLFLSKNLRIANLLFDWSNIDDNYQITMMMMLMMMMTVERRGVGHVLGKPAQLPIDI